MFNWFKAKTDTKSGPDFSKLNSLAKVEAAAAAGELVPMLLMPEDFGGLPGGPNQVYVPSWAYEQKERIDLGTVLPLGQEGKITMYEANASYKGDSFVPSAISIRAYDPGDFSVSITIW